MRLSDIDSAITECELFLAQTKSRGTRIENYLVGYLLVYICACFQTEIRNSIESNLSLHSADTRLKNYVDTSLVRFFQSIQIDSISKLLGFFGDDKKKAFSSSIQSSVSHKRATTLYSNIITNRHATAHSIGVQMTFNDLKEAYEKGHVILDLFIAALK